MSFFIISVFGTWHVGRSLSGKKLVYKAVNFARKKKLQKFMCWLPQTMQNSRQSVFLYYLIHMHNAVEIDRLHITDKYFCAYVIN